MTVLYLEGVSCQGEGEEFSEKEKNQRLQDETHGNREEKNSPENEEKSETLLEEFVEIETVGGGVLHAGIVPHAAGNARGREAKSEKERDFLRLRTLDPASHEPSEGEGERGDDEAEGEVIHQSLLRRMATAMAVRVRNPANQYHATSIR